MAERTYLEFHDEEKNSHKFYEVVLDGQEVTTRYGRIGTDGRSATKSYADEATARAKAEETIEKKVDKGYVPQEEEEPQVEESLEEETVAATPSAAANAAAQADVAPVLWSFSTGHAAFGIFIDEANCWVGNERGEIFRLTHEGQVERKYKLPDKVKCLVADQDWLYAGCDDGKVYDLTGKMPFVAYDVGDADEIDIYWIDIFDGILGVSDDVGNVVVINHDDDSQWRTRSEGRAGWMVRCDDIGVYHGHSKGVTMYDWDDGEVIWKTSTEGAVLFGWQVESQLYVATAKKVVQKLSKTGELTQTMRCDAAVFSCAASVDERFTFAADNKGRVYCFDAEGNRLWDLQTGLGSAFSMQYFDEKLYLVTTKGHLVCVDASAEAIAAAERGQVPEARQIEIPADLEQADVGGQLEEVAEADVEGVIVECYAEGNKLRVRPVSAGYNQDWNVQFPKDIREAGVRYVVEELRESARGGFYRAFGDIQRLGD